jgi:ankyrin repeat protein
MLSARDNFISAISTNDINTAQSLIETGSIDVTAPLNSFTKAPPLVLAAQHGRAAIVDLILNAGANIDQANVSGSTACHVAAEKGLVDVLERLLRRTPAPNLGIKDKLQRTPLDMTLLRNHDRAAAVLIAAGAPLDNRDSLLAVAAMSTACIRALVDRGVAIAQLRGGVHEFTPLHHVATAIGFKLDLAVLDMLVACGVDVNARDSLGDMCCHIAAAKSNYPMLRWLVERAELEERNQRGRTPLMEACLHSTAAAVQLLLAAGASVESSCFDGSSMAHLVLNRVSVLPLHALLAAGADVDVKNQAGVTVRRIMQYRNLIVQSSEVEVARQSIAKLQLELVRRRALQVCIGLQSRHLDALQMSEILQHACERFARASPIPFHVWWQIATTVKHFHKQ